jgi:hypothetical protein
MSSGPGSVSCPISQGPQPQVSVVVSPIFEARSPLPAVQEPGHMDDDLTTPYRHNYLEELSKFSPRALASKVKYALKCWQI